MAFTDPQSITINAVPKSLAKIKSDGQKTIYRTSDEEVSFTISHQESKSRTRHMVRADQRVVAADPLTAVNEYKSAGVYMVIDEPEYGFTDAQLDYIVQGLKTWLSTANVLKVCAGES